MSLTTEQCNDLYEALSALLQALQNLLNELDENQDNDQSNDQLIKYIVKLAKDIRKLTSIIDEKCDQEGEA